MNARECGARTRAGKACRKAAMPNGKCRNHGGASPVGVAHPSFKTGRYSKDLPARLAARLQEASVDPDLISMRQEIALVDARTNEVLSRLDSKEAAAHWMQLKDLVEQFRLGTATQRIQAAEALSTWSTEALSDYAVWAEVLDLMERRRKLAETESKRLAAMGQFLTASQAMVLLASVVDVIRRTVTDKQQLSAISREIGRLADQREGPGFPALSLA